MGGVNIYKKHINITISPKCTIKVGDPGRRKILIFSVVKTLDTPVCFLGTGESLNDLVKFNANYFVENLFSHDDYLKEE